MSGETLAYERRKAAPFVAEERERCAALAEAMAATEVAQWIREGRKVVKHDASEFTYTVTEAAEAGRQPETITDDMPGIVLTQEMSREEAKERWPEKAAEIDTFAARWNARTEVDPEAHLAAQAERVRCLRVCQFWMEHVPESVVAAITEDIAGGVER